MLISFAERELNALSRVKFLTICRPNKLEIVNLLSFGRFIKVYLPRKRTFFLNYEAVVGVLLPYCSYNKDLLITGHDCRLPSSPN